MLLKQTIAFCVKFNVKIRNFKSIRKKKYAMFSTAQRKTQAIIYFYFERIRIWAQVRLVVVLVEAAVVVVR